MAANKKQRETDNRGCPPGGATIPQPNGSAIGNPPFVATDEQREMVRREVWHHGQRYMAYKMGISEDTLSRHFAKEITEAKGEMLAAVSSVLMKKVLAGDGPSIRFWLITQGEGMWSPKIKHQHTGKDEGPIRTLDMSRFLEGKSEAELGIIAQILDELAAVGGIDIPGNDYGSPADGRGEDAGSGDSEG